ncbi:MAG: DnaD domain protein [Pseudobutyrivibrio sp.]|nr:DnaD domain protein [Pseudobutyrivibrio sp.]
MADILLHANGQNQVTCVSNSFIDFYMKDAQGEYVKIYLYLLRCLGRDGYEFSISQMADDLDHTQRDVLKAFAYWEKVGLLHLEYNPDGDLSGICLTKIESSAAKSESPAEKPAPSVTIHTPVQKTKSIPAMKSYSAEEISGFALNEAFSELTFLAETYLGKPLGRRQLDTLCFWFDSLHMSQALIEYLMEYCISNGHTSFDYMNSIAISWASEDITTVEQAQASSASYSGSNRSIKEAFGIKNRELIPAEQAFLDRWTKEFHFSTELICEACKRTILQTNKVSFSYANKILEDWHNANVKTIEDLAPLDSAFVEKSIKKLSETKNSSNTASKPNKFINFEQRSNYDYDALEKAILGDKFI